ncbi:undecaprenyl/decaprenyl-phosphate alpha-N-acetylglucosaminyl 1-phosphate transferase, partial [Candidatus Peregrinibacteria bacterium]|nr:undecaprenyl/decaprenyl-phosphate alpha-N-acetylglucosaminyl 1-phosphate transferase [Candidatus Peregrinibacteria bacterium]
VMVIVGIGVNTITNPFGGYIPLDQYKFLIQFGDITVTIMALSGLFTIAWIVLIVNTMNWMDGIPGMTSGITVIGGLTLFFLSISPIVDQPETATLALIVAMIALGFWLFDFYPPKIIIGDSGSMFFGLLLAVLAIFSGGKIATAFLILGFPILDAIYVIIYRMMNRRAPWKGGEWDKYRKAVHLHHRLLKFGFSERQALLSVYFVCAVFGVSALFMGTWGKFWTIVALFGLTFIIGLVLRAKSKTD